MMLDDKKIYQEQSKIEKPYFKSLREYSGASSIHGLAYLFEDRLIFYEKVLWLLTVFFAALFALLSSLSTYRNWKDDPILTSVATTAYSVQQVPFPSITICPQGAANDIVDAAIFKQFIDYLTENNIVYDDLSEEEVRNQTYNFLNDRYPGAKQLPNQLVRMLGSPDVKPDSKIESTAIYNPEDVENCEDPASSQSMLNSKGQEEGGKNIDEQCPSEFRKVSSDSCWHIPSEEMTYDEGSAYCKDKGNGTAEMLRITSSDEIAELYDLRKFTGNDKFYSPILFQTKYLC